MMDTKIREELIASAVSLILAMGKGTAAFWTGSLALLASAVDSLMDTFVSALNLYSLKVADRPADEDHAFGHGKAEAIGALFQALIILGSVLYLVYASFNRFILEVPLQNLGGGMAIILISLATSLWLTRRLSRKARQTGSVVLKTDSLHYAMDLYTQGGVFLSFLAIGWTGFNWVDPLMTLPIAVFISYQTFRAGKAAVDELMDREVSPEVRERVERVVESHRPLVKGMHNFKSRHVGSKMFLQLHLEMKRDLTFEEVHELEERIAGEIRREFGNVQVMIHADPEGHGLDQTDLM
jgi:cation diffusion facilitator family transporter